MSEPEPRLVLPGDPPGEKEPRRAPFGRTMPGTLTSSKAPSINLEDSGDELSCVGTREVRTPHSSATPLPRLTCVGGAQNATKRYDAYREVARKLKYFDREPLPLCVVATIRSIFPSQHGTYVGYRGPH